MRLPDGKYLVGFVALACIVMVSLAAWRIFWAQDKADQLCRKLDRVFVVLEARTQASERLTQDQKLAAIKLYESFRDDPPVCRTSSR